MPLSSYRQRGLVQVLLPRKIIPIIIIASIASAGVVAGLVYAPSSPGLPYVSPTYQAQKAPFQYQQIALNAAIYGVWYVPGTTTLILVIMASFPQTHFYGLWGPYGIVSPPGFNYQNNTIQGNFSIPVYVNYEKTYLVIPANTCPPTLLLHLPKARITNYGNTGESPHHSSENHSSSQPSATYQYGTRSAQSGELLVQF